MPSVQPIAARYRASFRPFREEVIGRKIRQFGKAGHPIVFYSWECGIAHLRHQLIGAPVILAPVYSRYDFHAPSGGATASEMLWQAACMSKTRRRA